MSARSHGVLVSLTSGVATAGTLAKLQERSTVFIEPGTPVYEGMIVGERSRPGDMGVDVARGNELMRGSGRDDNVLLEPPRVMTLEDALGYIADDELIEVTPRSLRLRKRTTEAASRQTSASRAAS